MFDTKIKRAPNPWKSEEEPPPPPRPAPAPAPGPLPAGVTPAVGGRLFEGMYDGDAPRQPKLFPDAGQPDYVDKPVEQKEPENLTGVADERLKKMKELLKKPGVSDAVIGAGKGVLAPGSDPAKAAPPHPSPTLTEGEKQAETEKHEKAVKEAKKAKAIQDSVEKQKREEAEKK